MSGFKVNFSVNNQLATPSIHAAPFAQRPAAGQPGRVFIDTDSPSTGIYRDTGTAWIVIGSPGIPEVDTLQTVTDRGNTTTQSITINSSDPPQFPLDVYGDTDIINVHARNGNDGVILFSKAGSHRWRAGNYHGGGNDYFSIYNMQENSDGILVNLSTNNVAIGGHTTAPTYKLDIAGSLANTGNAYLASSTGNRVGIGTTSPTSILHLFNGGGTGSLGINMQNFYGTSSFSVNQGFIDINAGGAAHTINLKCGNNTRFSTGGSTVFTFISANCGIGTTVNSGYQLDVNGTARVSGNIYLTTNTAYISRSTYGATEFVAANAGGGFKISNNKWIPAGSSGGGYLENNESQLIKQAYVGTNANTTTFSVSNAIIMQDSVSCTHTHAGITFSVNSTAASTYRTYLGTVTDNSSSIANTLQGIYIDVGLGSNTAANRYAGLFLGGSVGIGTSTPNASALVDITSTTKGFLPPRMTTTEKNAIANTAGLVVFDTTLAKLCVNSGAGWETITSV